MDKLNVDNIRYVDKLNNSLGKKLLCSFCMIYNYTILTARIYFKICEVKSNNLNHKVWLRQGCKASRRRQFSFNHKVAWISWYSFDQPWKDEWLNWTCKHVLVLNLGHLEWDPSTLTNRPLQLHGNLSL